MRHMRPALSSLVSTPRRKELDMIYENVPEGKPRNLRASLELLPGACQAVRPRKQQQYLLPGAAVTPREAGDTSTVRYHALNGSRNKDEHLEINFRDTQMSHLRLRHPVEARALSCTEARDCITVAPRTR